MACSEPADDVIRSSFWNLPESGRDLGFRPWLADWRCRPQTRLPSERWGDVELVEELLRSPGVIIMVDVVWPAAGRVWPVGDVSQGTEPASWPAVDCKLHIIIIIIIMWVHGLNARWCCAHPVVSPGFVMRRGQRLKLCHYVMWHSRWTSGPAAARWLIVLQLQNWSKELWVADICISWSHRLHNTWIVGCRDEIILGISTGPVGPTGFPWEWELLG